MAERVIAIDDMKLILLPPAKPVKVSQEEVESESINLLTVFAGIKQRVSKENKNRRQYMTLVR